MSGGSSIPRPEHPRPQFVRDAWINLNGKWEFELDPGVSGEARGLATGGEFSREIMVPFCMESELSGLGIKDFVTSVWYRRSFTLPDDWKGKRVLIHFGAVDYDAAVWINGQKVGGHRGGYTSFSLEITPYLKAGANIVTVRAVDETRSHLQGTGKQSMQYASYGCLYTRTTGIWQTVWLEAVPSTYVKSVRYYPNIAQGTLTVNAKLDGDTSGIAIKAEALAQGKKVGEAEAQGSSHVTFTIPLSEVKLWEPGKPFLYDLNLSLTKDGKPLDTAASYFGMREVHIQGKKVLINGKSVFQRLVLDQGFYPDGIYTAPSDEALRKDHELSMAVGFNGARFHEKVFEARSVYWADKLGYLVWGEYPNWGIDHANPKVVERYVEEWIESVERDFNSPAIVGWCPFNETPNNQNPDLLRSVYRVTKAIDTTRPVIDTSGYVHVETDIYDCHNYDQNPETFAKTYEPFIASEEAWHNSREDAPYLGQPYFVSEYGGIWWNPGQKDEKAWGYGDRPKTLEEFYTRYKGLTEALLFHPKMFAFCYTQLTDVEQEVNGIYTYDRKPKFDAEILKKINSQKAAIED